VPAFLGAATTAILEAAVGGEYQPGDIIVGRHPQDPGKTAQEILCKFFNDMATNNRKEIIRMEITLTQLGDSM